MTAPKKIKGPKIPNTIKAPKGFVPTRLKKKWVMRPTEVLLLISDLEGAYHHARVLGFEEDMNTLGEMKKPYYKMYFKLLREQNDSNTK